ncbi:MAG: gliding motility-associated C-terminal domain-containing protein, partial [Crocinitomicaceae bacterium]|nr:gliding motility-associated C-terminal domain-containing protein [Crocinitomicaceae bacterium]
AGFLTTNLSENSYEFIARDEPYCHNCQYYWNLGDGTTSQDIIVEHTFDGVYAYEVQLTAINEIGCIDSSFYTVPIPPSFYIPNSFTPNGDGINDVWAVVSKEVNTFDLRIFNRWGEQVFYSTDPSVPWIGDRQRESGYFVPDGVYTYVIKATGFRQETFEKTGSIVLTR